MRLVLFDLGTTLVDRAEGFRRWAWEFCAEHRLGPDAAAWLVTADDAGRTGRPEFFRNVRTRFGLAASEQALAEAYLERCPALVPPVPGVLAGLPRLRAAGWRIGVVGEGDHQLAALLCTGISGLVDGWAIAGPSGPSTSDAGRFALAARRCETGLDGGWLVSADVSAGIAAGLCTVRVSPKRGEAQLSGSAAAEEQVQPEREAGRLQPDRAAPGAAAEPAQHRTVPDTAAAIALLLG
ncbi:HAD family hydrolase [Amycolatopsis benzoatilytica]|uniref:HAD family hydrolase n=1 Tax=Amycolatopsis benzoatilytica TaxID=346045 RepID=UPI0003651384|nr:HAD family hydrolase [Amycolatopsis benzoatilytica]